MTDPQGPLPEPAFFDQAPTPLAAMDASGALRRVNAKAAGLLGLVDVPGGACCLVSATGFARRLRDFVAKVLEEGGRRETRLEMDGGGIRVVGAAMAGDGSPESLCLLHFEGGGMDSPEPDCFSARFRRAQELAGEGFWECDGQGSMDYLSEGLMNLLGIRGPLFGREAGEAFQKRIHPQDRQALMDDLSRAMFDDAPLEREVRFYRGGEEERVGLAMGRRVLACTGEPGVFGVLRDITERKELERELNEARRMAEDASKSKSRFLANMSHEMRTPLNGILGLIGLTLGQDLPKEARENLRMSRDSGQNLLSIINDILDITKIEAGRLELVKERFDLDQVLNSTVRLFSIEAKSKGVALRYVKSMEAPQFLYGDPVRLRQVLINLVGNAVKFTEAGEVELSVRPVNDPMDGGGDTLLEWTVRDTGCGLDESLRADIFDIFTQAEPARTRTHQGTGLGLAISKRLVEMMDGEITVSSEPDCGSTFTFTARFECAPEESTARDRGENRGIVLPTLRILLAEDNRVNQAYARRALEMEGHQVVCVENGHEALEALSGESFDLALMDIQMPHMDGVTATRAIRSGEAGVPSDFPVVALTAYAMKGDREEFMEAGMNDYVSKPFDSKDLIRVIARVMLRP
ncbi:ATP-binding protein [Desulfohalovibrio reitneri]|uniref:ATP-binding protein n=1 Tax=Desulfohalovibrio reitneri TaxID=1307759 RepID=UPI000691744F|nr:ATP-binding protein [Desulfohalovibrio reitneri]